VYVVLNAVVERQFNDSGGLPIRSACQFGSAAADSLLSYYETAATSAPGQVILKATAGVAAFERAKTWEGAGDVRRAAEHYREFLRLYDMAPEPHRYLVQEATSALSRLTRR
jgi:hypothetical protein